MKGIFKGVRIKVFDEFGQSIGSFKGDMKKSEDWFEAIKRKMG